MLHYHSDLLSETRDAPMAETTPSREPAPTPPDPRYADTGFLRRVVDEYEAEVCRLGLLTADESVPLTKKVKTEPEAAANPPNKRARRRTQQSTHFETDQRGVKQAQRLWEDVERLRARGEVIEANRRTLLYPNQAFELLPADSWVGPNDRGPLSLQPQSLEPERQQYWDALKRTIPSQSDIWQHPRALLNPHCEWNSVPEGGRLELQTRQRALLTKAARLATSGELRALGLWFPAHSNPSPPSQRDDLVMGFGRSFQPTPLPLQVQVLELLKVDDELVRLIDREACAACQDWSNYQWSGPQWWQPEWQKLPPESRREPDFRRREFVGAVLEELVGVVVRNGRGWAMELERTPENRKNWRGWVRTQAEERSEDRHIALKEQGKTVPTGAYVSDDPSDSEVEESPELGDTEGAKQSRRSRSAAFLRAQRALTAQLTEDEHNVLALRFFFGVQPQHLSRREVARLLGLLEDAVEMLEKKALGKLREQAQRDRWEDPLEEGPP